MALRKAAAVISFAALYVVLGALSFATAYVAENTATVWIPTGFSLALLISKGDRNWPAVALGSFILNLGDNLVFSSAETTVAVAVALAIAAGNTGEALLGSFLARTFAGGPELLTKPVYTVTFAALCATFPPLVSMGIGVPASYFGGLVHGSQLREAMLTWYLADAVGVLILTAPLIALFDTSGSHTATVRRWSIMRAFEAAGLIAGLLFVSQAMSGIYIVPAMRSWPRNYMVIPLLLWAVFRFRTRGVLIAILLVASVSVAGTMTGFEAFPAASHSRSLLYLQLFLGLLSVTTLAITAALTEIDQLQLDLETLVRDRMSEVDRLVRSRDLFSALVVHELRSPLYGMRNALRAAAKTLDAGTLAKTEAVTAMMMVGETCSILASRVGEILGASAPETGGRIVPAEPLRAVLERIGTAHGLRTQGKERLALRFDDANLYVGRPTEVERILDGLIHNAVRHGPSDTMVEVCAFRHGAFLELLVTDNGSGVNPSVLAKLFRPEMYSTERQPARMQSGRGLFLASELAIEMGGRLTYCVDSARTTFRVVLPA